MGYALRPYQQRGVDAACEALGRVRRVCLVCPTGGGKTVMGSEVVRRAVEHGRRVLILVHREELLKQTSDKLGEGGLTHGVIKAGFKEDRSKPVQLATVQTLLRRDLPPADLIIPDEAHRRDYVKAVNKYPDALVLGLTATPERFGGESLHGEYDELVIAATYSELLADGWILPPRIWAPHTPDLRHAKVIRGDYSEADLEKVMAQRKLVGDTVEQWKAIHDKLRPDERQTIVYAVTVNHAEMLLAEFRGAGISSELITANTESQTRALAMAAARRGKIDVLINVGVFVEGLDIPGTRTIVLARPTKSLPLYMQMCGRGCRPAPGKDWYRILDHAGNTLVHGPPHLDRPWSLKRTEKARRKGKSAVPTKQCRVCYYVYLPHESFTGACPACGWQQPPRLVKYEEGSLVEVKPEDLIPKADRPKISDFEKERRRLWAIARGAGEARPFEFVRRGLIEYSAKQHAAASVGPGNMPLPVDPEKLW